MYFSVLPVDQSLVELHLNSSHDRFFLCSHSQLSLMQTLSSCPMDGSAGIVGEYQTMDTIDPIYSAPNWCKSASYTVEGGQWWPLLYLLLSLLFSDITY